MTWKIDFVLPVIDMGADTVDPTIRTFWTLVLMIAIRLPRYRAPTHLRVLRRAHGPAHQLQIQLRLLEHRSAPAIHDPVQHIMGESVSISRFNIKTNSVIPDYGYTTNYSNGAGGDGGGFMPGSQTDSPSAKRSYGKDTLRPVTIRQLLDAQQPHPDAEYFTISGADTTQVTFVGQIRNISTQATNTTYKLDDGTGIIEVKLWVDSEAMNDDSTEDDARAPKLTEQAYARVWGRIKVLGSKQYIACNIIRPIQDFNEIQYHLLEATAVHLHFTRGPPEALQQGKAGANGQQQGQNGGYGMADGLSHASARARKVFECIKDTPQTNEGLHAQDIAARLGMQMSEVMKAAEELTGLGKVYTTLDDMTWAILDV
nr:replication factor a protein 2 [Quercus suber]